VCLEAQQPVARQLDAATRQALLPQLRQAPASIVVGGMPLQRRRAAMDKKTMVIVPTAHGDSAVPIAEVDVYFSGAGTSTISPLVLVYDRSTEAMSLFGGESGDVAAHLPISCGVSDGDAPPVVPPAAMDPVVLASKPLLQLELAVETDDTFFAMVGGTVEKAQTYLAALYTVVSALYEDEIHVTIHVSNVRIWTGDPADPYQAKGDPFKLRDAMAPYWKNNYKSVKRDVFQGLTASTWGGGGFGYFDGLCGKNGDFGFSTASVKATDNLTSFGFVYDVYIVAHELGHNFNAVHTHDCYWAPPIDTCIAADGISAGCLPAGQKPLPNPGSIMSYCANTNLDAGRGYTMRMTFLPRVMALMRQTVEAAVCVQEPPTPTLRLVSPRGNEVFEAGDTTTIRWRASSEVDQVALAYSRNGGATWVGIASFVDARAEAYAWELPEICSNAMLVRIVQLTNTSVGDTSIRTFTVTQPNDPNGLVAWYPFNGTTNDSAPCGYYPLEGVATYGADRSNTSGRAVTLNGTSSLVAKNFVADFTTFTAAFWFKVNDVNGVQTFLGQNWEEGPSFYTYLWQGTLGAAIYFQGEGVPFQIWANGCTPGLWYHVALVYNGSAAQIFVNGALVSTVPKTGVLLKNTTPFYVGARKNTEYMRGALDDVRIYRRALGASEISKIASELASPPPTPMLLAPTNTVIDLVAPITMQWTPCANAWFYHVQVGTRSDLAPSSRVVDDSNSTTTSFTTTTLAPATTYHWHVRAGNAAGWSDWSPTWSFTTGGVSSVSDDITNDPVDHEEIYDQLGRLVATSVTGAANRTSLGDGLYMSVEHRGPRIFARSFIHVR
jgi:hypothetical protein